MGIFLSILALQVLAADNEKGVTGMRNFLFIPILLSILLALSETCAAAEVDMNLENGKRAAQIEIDKFLKNQKLAGPLQAMGFESQSDIDNAEIGEAFQIFTFDNDKLMDDSDTQDLHPMVVPTKQWYFFIVNGKKINILLQMYHIDGNWSPGTFGGSKLAKSYTK